MTEKIYSFVQCFVFVALAFLMFAVLALGVFLPVSQSSANDSSVIASAQGFSLSDILGGDSSVNSTYEHDSFVFESARASATTGYRVTGSSTINLSLFQESGFLTQEAGSSLYSAFRNADLPFVTSSGSWSFSDVYYFPVALLYFDIHLSNVRYTTLFCWSNRGEYLLQTVEINAPVSSQGAISLYEVPHKDTATFTLSNWVFTEAQANILKTIFPDLVLIGVSEGGDVDQAYEQGFNEGLSQGYENGYSVGFSEGAEQGYANPTTLFLAPVQQFLALPIFGGYSLGDFFLVALFVLIALIFIKMFAGG